VSNEESTPVQESLGASGPDSSPLEGVQRTPNPVPVSLVQAAGDTHGGATRSKGLRSEAGRRRIAKGTPHVGPPVPLRAAGKDDGPSYFASESDVEPGSVAVIQPNHPVVELGEPIDVDSLSKRNGLERRELSLLGLG
jgi:hypothetical protein